MSNNRQLDLLEKLDRVPENFQKAAELLRDLDVTDFYYYGGALRDLYLGRKENDIDVNATLPADSAFWQTVNDELENLSRKPYGGMFNHRNSKRLKEIFAEKGMRCIGYSGVTIKVQKEGGPIVDIRISAKENGMRDGRFFEAPMNALTMSKHGDVYGLPDSLEDISNKVFKPQEGMNKLKQTGKALIRFAHLQEENPDLSYVAADDAHPLVFAWQFMQKHTGIPNKLGIAIYKLRKTVIEINP